MTQENTRSQEHRLTLDGRSRLSVWGTEDVERFDEEAVVLKTCQGTLEILGKGLSLRSLTPDGGQVTVEGTIGALIYQEPREKRSFLRRLLP